MNRRNFLIQLCTLGGICGLGGMLSAPFLQSNSLVTGTSRDEKRDEKRELRREYDESSAKKKLAQIEAAGLTPREAMYWEKTKNGYIRCLLCPNSCVLGPYERGRCKVRISMENHLATLVYGKPCSVAIDPIEKKPVFHLLPGSTTFSIATAGCCLSCQYCQNWQISQEYPENLEFYDLPPDKLVSSAIAEKCHSIAYTYTEPTVFYEYVLDTAKLAKKNNLYNVIVSSGYINQEPLKELIPWIDVMKVDLKGFTEEFYKNICRGRLQPVLDALKLLANSKTMIDIVTLVVPTLNDDRETMKKMFRWILENLGRNVSLFLSRFHPTYQLRNLPPTPVSTLEALRNDALEVGLPFVYIGNVPGHKGENTFCPGCGKIIIGRIGYHVTENRVKSGKCEFCGVAIPGVWE